MNGDVRNDGERDANLAADLADLAGERDVNNAVGADGAMVLPTAHESCATWTSSKQRPAAANCMYLIRAEQRFGNGDGVYTLAEQRRASDINNDDTFHISRFAGGGRVLRFGMEVNF